MPTPRTALHPLRLLLRIPVPWVFVLAYLAGAAVESFLAPRVAPRVLWLPGIRLVGGALLGIGVVIAGWGWLTFRRARTTTVPGERSATLVTWGPYRRTRNPMYIGLTLAYLGEAGLLRQLCPLALLPLVIAYLNWVGIPLEESKLLEGFGDQYEGYRERGRRWV